MSIASELAKLVNVFRDWPHEEKDPIKVVFTQDRDESYQNVFDCNMTPTEVAEIIDSGNPYVVIFKDGDGAEWSLSGYTYLKDNRMGFVFNVAMATKIASIVRGIISTFMPVAMFSEETGEWGDWIYQNADMNITPD